MTATRRRSRGKQWIIKGVQFQSRGPQRGQQENFKRPAQVNYEIHTELKNLDKLYIDNRFNKKNFIYHSQ